jgi:hypothetical protein
MRGALIVGGVAVLGLGAWWLYKRNRDKAEREQLASNMAAALGRRDRARAFLWTLRSNPLLRAQASPAVVLQNEVNAGIYNRATAGNMARGFELNYSAGSV